MEADCTIPAIVSGEHAHIMDDKRQQEFEALLQSHQGIVFKVANTYCWQPDDRADLVQDILAQLWRAWPQYDASRTLSTWMYRIALNVAISSVRKASRDRALAVPLEEDLHDALAAETTQPAQARLQAFIERQAPLDRALLLLYLEDKSQREIAEILGITSTNVSTKISRMKQKIRAEL
jgi:RNA polymerase sigma-70 factor, ECF subfamily